MKLLEENIGRTISNINHSKWNHKQHKQTTLRMGENIYVQSDQQGINLQNTQTAHRAQYQITQSVFI